MRIIAILAVLTFSTSLAAEIVKWTDENGKVHYGDRVPEKYKEQAEQVNVGSSNVISNENKPPVKRSSRSAPVRVPPSDNKSEMSQQQAQRAMCSEAAQRYKDLTTVKHGKQEYRPESKTIESTVLVGKDGETYTRREQNRLAEQFRKDMNSKGCNIPQTRNMKL